MRSPSVGLASGWKSPVAIRKTASTVASISAAYARTVSEAALGWVANSAAMAASASARAAASTSTMRARRARASFSAAQAPIRTAQKASLSKIGWPPIAAGRVARGRRDSGPGSEARAGEASWGRINHDHLCILDLGDGKPAFVRPVGQEPEDAADAREARPLREGGRAQCVGPAASCQRADGGDAVIGQRGDRMRLFAVGGSEPALELCREARVGQGKPAALDARHRERARGNVPAGEAHELRRLAAQASLGQQLR